MQNGYGTALKLAAEKLAALSPDEVCGRTGARFIGGEYYIPWFNKEISLSGGKVAERIIRTHYLTAQNGKKEPAGRLIAYRDAGGARFYESKFIQRAAAPLAKRFGRAPLDLVRAGEARGGKRLKIGDAAIVLTPLPYVPLTIIIRSGGDEFEPAADVLFDETANSWFCAEDLAVYASLCAYELL